MKYGPVLLFIASLSIGHLSAASFDCRKAVTDTERLICSTPALSKADEAMAAAYKKARAAVKDAEEKEDLRQDQLAWLKNRVGECSGNPTLFWKPALRGAPCIAQEYKLRTAALEVYSRQVARGPNQAVVPTGAFDTFETCLSCGESRFQFMVLPTGAIKFSVEATNGRNLGTASGQFRIDNKVAVYTDPTLDCKLTLTFTHATVNVEQEGYCGFGYGVHVDGLYLKTSNAVPIFP